MFIIARTCRSQAPRQQLQIDTNSGRDLFGSGHLLQVGSIQH